MSIEPICLCPNIQSLTLHLKTYPELCEAAGLRYCFREISDETRAAVFKFIFLLELRLRVLLKW